MIAVVLSGGLGNQMFQCACAFALAQKQQTKVLLDLSLLRQDSRRQYALKAYNLSAKTIDNAPNEIGKLSKLIHGIPKEFTDYIEKNEFQYDSDLDNLSRNIRLIGYWQHPKYFENFQVENIFQMELWGEALNLKNTIEGSEHSVSMHIRRGDYVNDANTNKVHGVCSLDYYQMAIKTLAAQLQTSKLKVFIFSDDPEWCQQHINFIEDSMVMPIMGDVEDLLLMSKCQHNIIANSSYSWWAAYLNKNKNKQVIAPKQWFNESNHNTEELIPTNWIRI